MMVAMAISVFMVRVIKIVLDKSADWLSTCGTNIAESLRIAKKIILYKQMGDETDVRT